MGNGIVVEFDSAPSSNTQLFLASSKRVESIYSWADQFLKTINISDHFGITAPESGYSK